MIFPLKKTRAGLIGKDHFPLHKARILIIRLAALP